MKPQSPEKVSINSHEVTCTQNVYQYKIDFQIQSITILIYIKLESIINWSNKHKLD